MKSGGPLKHVVLAFVLAIVGYALFYRGIEHRRNEKGPWLVIFTNNAAGTPEIIVDQPTVGVTNVHITFDGEPPPARSGTPAMSIPPDAPRADQLLQYETNFAATSAVQHFSRPYPVPFTVPFGKCVFLDTTFLPGTITFALFGHEIELLPRVLIIDFKEHAWQSGATIAVPRAKLAPSSSNKPQ
jgi:hypothetical protein